MKISVPESDLPLVDANGFVTPAWYDFFLDLAKKSGEGIPLMMDRGDRGDREVDIKVVKQVKPLPSEEDVPVAKARFAYEAETALFAKKANNVDTAQRSISSLEASNAKQLNNKSASYYTDIPARLGFTPLNDDGNFTGTIRGNNPAVNEYWHTQCRLPSTNHTAVFRDAETKYDVGLGIQLGEAGDIWFKETAGTYYIKRTWHRGGSAMVWTSLVSRSSDEKMKNIVQDKVDPFKSILAINPVVYAYKPSSSLSHPKGKRLGFTAQELCKVFKDICYHTETPDGEPYEALHQDADHQLISMLWLAVRKLIEDKT